MARPSSAFQGSLEPQLHVSCPPEAEGCVCSLLLMSYMPFDVLTPLHLEAVSTDVQSLISFPQKMDASPFSLLCPELRNLIYEFTFYNKYSTTLQTSKIQHPLTQTCRRLRQESLGLYYSLTRFNAHLDDGPATPLATWFKAIGREQCLLLDEVNIWDIHMLNATVHGDTVTKQLLAKGTSDGRNYVLQPVGSWLLNRGWYLRDIVLALHSMDLSLARLCLTGNSISEELGLTSHFAIVPSSAEQTRDEGHALETLCVKLGFTETMRKQTLLGLQDGHQTVRLREEGRELVLKFEGLSLVEIEDEAAH